MRCGRPINRIAKGGDNAQIDCHCGLRLVDFNIGASYNACAASAGGRHGNASCRRLWPRQDQNRRRMRCTDYRPPDPPRRPSVCAMAGRYLCFVRVNATLWRSVQPWNRTPAPCFDAQRSSRLFIASTLTILRLLTFSRDVGHRLLLSACHIMRRSRA
jgi:hypothetical protein